MSVLSNLFIDDIKIIENEFKLNINIKQSEVKEEIPVNIIPEFFSNEKNPKVGRVKLTVELYQENFIELEMPYYLKVVIMGHFSLNDNEEGNIIEQYAINMTSMLFPYVRSYIAGLTGLTGIPSVNIPAINIFKLFEDIDSED